ncbi:related to tRNA (cytosine-5-)-methyltransferase [Cephalotrichum gorgonifer]|uniref:Related to tRNA (Cytosine-5-)-methyltransferase n=1 Tax=Cephalotrichum gorgonifer TaxID=2041049 RepID=A0AAE8N3Z4_9PEZI|nr:related to tRNA (cytosine-5-)-methyltransferase [Cephalotrichum gorgonifer]
MGFRGKKGRGGRGGGGGWGKRQTNRDDPGNQQRYSSITKQNEKMENNYNTILGFSEEEKAEFWDALKRDLPSSFRFCGSKGHALAVRDLLETRYFPNIQKIEYEGKKVELPQPVPWYPDNLAWSMTTPKNVVRKFPPFSAFQKYLVSETSVGHITRQEVVSMIPPLLLDVRPGMTVLDLCAAPGSKSSQLLEMLHVGEELRVKKALRGHAAEDGLDLGPETKEEAEADLSIDAGDNGRATGLLIANDADYKRCHLLTHQLKRLSSANLLITNHDATQFPAVKLPPNPAEPKKTIYLKYDRILADVPCSGDGTLRKNASLWNNWVPGSALGLHLTQVRILVRSLQMLKVGGRVVYSTCSMNPIENESVVGAAIERCGGLEKIDLVDCSDQLPELKRRPGMKDWKVMDKAGQFWNSWSELEEKVKADPEYVIPGKLSETMFPKYADIPLERCMRVYAHLQDTGGFFITVLEKKAEFKAKPESEPKREPGSGKIQSSKPEDGVEAPVETPIETPIETPTETPAETPAAAPVEAPAADLTEDNSQITGKRQRSEADDEASSEAKKLKVDDAKTEDTPAPAIDESAEASEATPTEKPAAPANGEVRKDTSIKYEAPYVYLAPDHPIIQEIKQAYKLSDRFPLDRFLVRNESGEPAKAIYYSTGLGKDILSMNDGRGLKVINGGVKMFMKQDVPSPDVCRWRIQSEGIPIIQGYVGESRIVRLTKRETLRTLLIQMFPKIADGGWENLGEIGERVRDMGMGCSVLRIEPDGTEEGFKETIVLPLWKSVHSLNLMLPKEERSAMLLRLFNDTTPLVNNGLQMQKEREEKRKEEAAAAAESAAATPEANGEETPAAETEAVPNGGDASGETPDVVMGDAGGAAEPIANGDAAEA